MLYQDMLTGYLYEAPEPQFYSGVQMVYDGLGNPLGFLPPFVGAAETVSPRFVPVASQTLNGLGQAALPQPQMAMPQQALQPVSQTPAIAATFAPAPAMLQTPDMSMQTSQIPVPGQLQTLAPATGVPGYAPVGPGLTPAAPAPAGEPGTLYCYSLPQPGVAIERVIPPPTSYHRRRLFRRRRF